MQVVNTEQVHYAVLWQVLEHFSSTSADALQALWIMSWRTGEAPAGNCWY